MPDCSNGHPLREVSRQRENRVVEKVVYKTERIKHFNREGSEFWGEVKVPDIEEQEVEMECISYVCDQCNESTVVEEEVQSPDISD